jgi:hypothetical protein
LFPIKWDQLLKVSGESTAVALITKCCPRKNTKNKPESAMATFLAIEEDIIPIIVEFSKFLLAKIRLKLRINKQ